MTEHKTRTKDITVYFYRMNKENGEHLSAGEIEKMIKKIEELPVDIEKDNNRFDGDEGEEECVLLDNETDWKLLNIKGKINKAHQNCVHGIYFRRRRHLAPYINSGTANLQELDLGHENNVLAEVTYFIIDRENQVLTFVNNVHVGGCSRFETYINAKLLQCAEGTEKESEACKIAFPIIIKRDSEIDFEKLQEISKVEIKIAGNLQQLEDTIESGEHDSFGEMQSVLAFADKYNSKNLSLTLSMGRSNEKMDKNAISGLFTFIKNRLRGRDGSMLRLHGKVDNDPRVIDLLNEVLCHKTTITYNETYVPYEKVFERLYKIYNEQLETLKKEQML